MAANLSIRRFVERFDRFCFPSKSQVGYTIPLLGLDASGKTSLLQRLKVGDLVRERTPTLGLYLEIADVHLHQISPHLLKIPSWHVGSCGKRLPRTFPANIVQAVNPDALIWLTLDCRLATKQDMPNAASTRQIEDMFPAGPSIFIVGTTLNPSLTHGALPEALQWLVASIENTKAGDPLSPLPTQGPRSLKALEVQLDVWLERAGNDSSTARFLGPLHACPRNIFVARCLWAEERSGIQKYTSADEGTQFHFTMTYFWIQVVHFGICGMPESPPQADSDSEPTSFLESMLDSNSLFDSDSVISENWSFVEENNKEDDSTVQDDQESPCPGEDALHDQFDPGFLGFLRLNPHAVDEDLWMEYYSRELMMSPKARDTMALPDKGRLPNLVGRDLILSAFRWRA
ncbi:hypothetical protein DFH08DRAFT_1001758 [Mycena albidolilacea]|uniref:Uncharacterized protein n=1 Tax=Mycena albidolilacea TaxID=1033008 RepID=A0AAD7A3K2_9AGAR|nr:hypothetical protein DFH08DRAFT_1001758 [Mycena albidolilacea]